MLLWMEKHGMNAGDYVFIPKGTPHGFHNYPANTVEFLCYAVPGIFTAGYFRKIGKVLSAGGHRM